MMNLINSFIHGLTITNVFFYIILFSTNLSFMVRTIFVLKIEILEFFPLYFGLGLYADRLVREYIRNL